MLKCPILYIPPAEELLTECPDKCTSMSSDVHHFICPTYVIFITITQNKTASTSKFGKASVQIFTELNGGGVYTHRWRSSSPDCLWQRRGLLGGLSWLVWAITHESFISYRIWSCKRGLEFPKAESEGEVTRLLRFIDLYSAWAPGCLACRVFFSRHTLKQNWK